MFSYKKYFEQIKPRTQLERYNRFLFAFLSVHTTWRFNKDAYLLMKDRYHTDETKTKELLKESRVGLYNHRTEYITEFTQKFLENPGSFCKRRKETWKGYRDRLMKEIKGLGHAKTSFAIEMLYPNACWVTCVDTHIIQLFGYEPNNMSRSKYDLIEDTMLAMARSHGLLPTEMRWKVWDTKQGHTNPRYWSYVLE